jgi:hypothetical protein
LAKVTLTYFNFRMAEYRQVLMSIKTLSTREVYRNPWLRVREDQIQRDNGAHGIYGVVDKDDCAVIIPIEGDRIYFAKRPGSMRHP